MSDVPAKTDATQFDDAGVQVTDVGDSVTISVRLDSSLEWYYIVTSLMMAFLMAGIVFVDVFQSVEYFLHGNREDVGEFIYISVMLGILGLAFASITAHHVYHWIETSRGRHFCYDRKAGTVEFSSVPHFGCVLVRDDIENVVLGTGKHRDWNFGYVCFRLHSQRRLFRIQQKCRLTSSYEDPINVLRPVAEKLADVLKRPIAHREKVTPVDLSWR